MEMLLLMSFDSSCDYSVLQ